MFYTNFICYNSTRESLQNNYSNFWDTNEKKLISLLLVIGVTTSIPLISSMIASASPLQNVKQETQVSKSQSDTIISHTIIQPNEIYNKFNNFDLQNYKVSLDNRNVNVTPKPTNGTSFAVTNNTNKNNLDEINNIINSNKFTKDLLKKELKDGNQIVGFSVTKRVIQQTTNEKTHETTCEFLTNKEVNF